MSRKLALLLAIALGGCAGETAVSGGVSVAVTSPELIPIDYGLYVVADADQPMFYSEGWYWMYRDRRWYRSRHYDRDWLYFGDTPPRLHYIHDPTAYVHYRRYHQEARREFREQGPFEPTQPERSPRPYPQPPMQQPPRPGDEHRIPPPRTLDQAAPEVERDANRHH